VREKEEGRHSPTASGPQLPSPMSMAMGPTRPRGAKSYRIVGERDLSVSAKELFLGDIRRGGCGRVVLAVACGGGPRWMLASASQLLSAVGFTIGRATSPHHWVGSSKPPNGIGN
jgi:hypothetical protein